MSSTSMVPYAIGGAIALGFYTPPRATVDVDVNAFVALVADLDSCLEPMTNTSPLSTPSKRMWIRRSRPAHGAR